MFFFFYLRNITMTLKALDNVIKKEKKEIETHEEIDWISYNKILYMGTVSMKSHNHYHAK